MKRVAPVRRAGILRDTVLWILKKTASRHETNLSTQAPKASARSRFSQAEPYARRSPRPGAPPRQRPSPVERMISKSRRAFRFNGRRDVQEVLRRGRRARVELGRVVWARVRSPADARVLFVVPKSVSKKSTVRNRIRRQMTEALRRQWREEALPIAAVIYIDPAVAYLSDRARNTAVLELPRRLASFLRRP